MIIDEQPSIDNAVDGREEDIGRSAKFYHHVAVSRCPARKRRCDMIGTARDHRNSEIQSQVGRGLGGDRANTLVASADRRHERRIDLANRNKPVVIAACRDIHESGLERPVVLHLNRGGEARSDVVRCTHDVTGAAHDLRFVRLQPHEFRADQLLAVAGAGAA